MIRFYNREFPCNLFGKVHGYLDRDDFKKQLRFSVAWLVLTTLWTYGQYRDTFKLTAWCNKLQY